ENNRAAWRPGRPPQPCTLPCPSGTGHKRPAPRESSGGSPRVPPPRGIDGRPEPSSVEIQASFGTPYHSRTTPCRGYFEPGAVSERALIVLSGMVTDGGRSAIHGPTGTDNPRVSITPSRVRTVIRRFTLAIP